MILKITLMDVHEAMRIFGAAVSMKPSKKSFAIKLSIFSNCKLYKLYCELLFILMCDFMKFGLTFCLATTTLFNLIGLVPVCSTSK